MRVYNIPNIIPKNTIMNTTLNSNPIQLLLTYSYAIQIVFTGTPTGTFKLQASCDAAANAVSTGLYTGINAPVNWTDIPNTSTMISSAGNVLFNIQDVGYNWVRINYADGSSGMATSIITVSTFNGKSV